MPAGCARLAPFASPFPLRKREGESGALRGTNATSHLSEPQTEIRTSAEGAAARRKLSGRNSIRGAAMNTLTTTFNLRLAVAAALAVALAACGDKPATSAPAAADAPAAAPAADPAATASAEPAAPKEAPPSPAQAPTARDLAAAPPHSIDSSKSAPTAPARTAAEPAGGPERPAAASSAGTPRYANVVSVQPVKQKVDRKREVCRDERVVHKARPKDDHQIAGTVIGAIAGGVIGNQVGGGRGRDIATVAGAVGGGYAGKKIQQGQQDRNTYTTTERRCREVNEPSEEVVAYDVVYEYLGTTQKVRLDHDPGERVELPVRGIE